MALDGGFRLRGIPQTSELLTTGNVYFVSSVTGSSGNSGESIAAPLATLDQATNKCTANQHDIVYILPNHAETISSATSWVPDIAGVQYIGIGVGTDAPELTFSATASRIPVSAANVTFKNIHFVAGISAIVEGVSVTGDYFTMENCKFKFSTTAYDFISMLDLDTAHHAVIRNNHFIAENATAGSDHAINIDDCDYAIIEGNTITGDYAVAGINSASSDAVSVGLVVRDNDIYNDDTASTFGGAIHFPIAHTGILAGNRCVHLNDDEGGSEVDPGSLVPIENYGSVLIDKSGILVPAAVST